MYTDIRIYRATLSVVSAAPVPCTRLMCFQWRSAPCQRKLCLWLSLGYVQRVPRSRARQAYRAYTGSFLHILAPFRLPFRTSTRRSALQSGLICVPNVCHVWYLDVVKMSRACFDHPLHGYLVCDLVVAVPVRQKLPAGFTESFKINSWYSEFPRSMNNPCSPC